MCKCVSCKRVVFHPPHGSLPCPQFLGLNFLPDGELTSTIIGMLVTKAQEEPHFNALFARLCAVVSKVFENAVEAGVAGAGAGGAVGAADSGTAAGAAGTASGAAVEEASRAPAVTGAAVVGGPAAPAKLMTVAAIAAAAAVPPLPPTAAGEEPRRPFKARLAVVCQAEFLREVRGARRALARPLFPRPQVSREGLDGLAGDALTEAEMRLKSRVMSHVKCAVHPCHVIPSPPLSRDSIPPHVHQWSLFPALHGRARPRRAGSWASCSLRAFWRRPSWCARAP